MKENEAISILNNYEIDFAKHGAFKTMEALEIAVSSLEEIQQYRSIGTVSECREAVEKRRAKKYERGADKDVRCPICGTFTTDIYEHRFCTYCGQRLE